MIIHELLRETLPTESLGCWERQQTAPLPEDDGRKPGDQRAMTSEQCQALTRHVDEQARNAIEAFMTLVRGDRPVR